MLDTLIQIGKLMSKSKDEWGDHIEPPDKFKKKPEVKYHISYLIFDLDQGTVDLKAKKEYDYERETQYFNLKLLERNGKAYFVTVYPDKMDQLAKSLFGGKTLDATQNGSKGHFLGLLESDYPHLAQSSLAEHLKKIFELKKQFFEYFPDGKASNSLKISGKDAIALIVTAVKWSENGSNESIPLCNVDGFQAFAKERLFFKEAQGAQTNRLCYATGNPTDDVATMTTDARDGLNKMFVKTTLNYASNFDADKLNQNYQVSNAQKILLERGSAYTIKNLRIRIAGLDHCILLHLSQLNEAKTKLSIEKIQKFKKITELLFLSQDGADLETAVDAVLEDRDADLFWITFLAFESDGNFFKTVHLIQNVNGRHLFTLKRYFRETSIDFKTLEGAQWDEIRSYGDKDNRKIAAFNFLSLYRLIPVREDKGKKNPALDFFKRMLEKKPIPDKMVFGYFIELLMCHRFARYNSYTNIKKRDPKYFDFAIRDTVFQYLALLEILKKLKILKKLNPDTMSSVKVYLPPFENPKNDSEKTQNYYHLFFHKMGYNDDQTALFYLGRLLSSVAFAQNRKGHTNKPILNKLNFNGLDHDSFLKLFRDLTEKVVQYNLHYDYEQFVDKVGRYLYLKDDKGKDWQSRVPPEEAFFYMMLGYAHKLPKSQETSGSNDDSNHSEADN